MPGEHALRPGRQRGLSAAQQFVSLRSGRMPPGRGLMRQDGFTWTCTLQPTPLSREYDVRIEYRRDRSPHVFVDKPDLVTLAEGRDLPHVYEQSPTRLCLYLPGSGEWHDRLLVGPIVIPWASLWLFYFEDWLTSGEWRGGGQHPPRKEERDPAQHRPHHRKHRAVAERRPPMAKAPRSPGVSTGRSNTLRPPTRQMIWARAAGRCQYRGCNCDLIGDPIAGKDDGTFGFVAHIIADAPDGPRGDPILSPRLGDDVYNLMLLCHPHHKLIDVDQKDIHTVEVLQAMKAAHEERIAIVTAIQPERASQALVFTTTIGARQAPVTFAEMSAAMLPERYPAEPRPISLEVVGSGSRDSDPDFWAVEARNLGRQFATKVQARIETRGIQHLTVFALAPQPLLIELGRLLGDISDVEVRQLHREPKGWRWAGNEEPIRYTVERPTAPSGTPALVIGISATIEKGRITGVLGDACIWAIHAEGAHNDIMRCPEDLAAFRRILRGLLDEIKAAHGEQASIAVFPAVPVSAAVEIGRVWMPKADLPLVVYDQNRQFGGFQPTLTVAPQR